MRLDHPQRLCQSDHHGWFITPIVLLRARQRSPLPRVGVSSATWLRRSCGRRPGLCNLGMCLSLHLHRLGSRVQHHHVHWHCFAPHVLHGVHLDHYLETTTGAPSSTVEVEARQDRPLRQHSLSPFLRCCVCLCILPACAESRTLGDELGHRRVWRHVVGGLRLLYTSRKARLCRASRVR